MNTPINRILRNTNSFYFCVLRARGLLISYIKTRRVPATATAIVHYSIISIPTKGLRAKENGLFLNRIFEKKSRIYNIKSK